MRSRDVPLGRGRHLSLYAHARDDREENPRRYPRLPSWAWWVHASLLRDEDHIDRRLPMKEQADQREHDLGTVAKGWWRVGWTKYRFKTLELEFVVGGEDNMVQAAIKTPALSWAVGGKLPRTWADRWVYERRVWAIRVGYLGSLARVEFAYDDAMDNMGDYYRRKLENGQDDRPVIRGRKWPSEAAMWPGWAFYVGGTSVWERQVISRILGARVYTCDKAEPVSVLVRMPEGFYDAKVILCHETWKRPRAWWSEQRKASEIVLERPPMFAGKGENSYDLGDDCYYSVHSRDAITVEQAVEHYVEMVQEQRRRHGKPASMKAST